MEKYFSYFKYFIEKYKSVNNIEISEKIEEIDIKKLSNFVEN